MKTAEGGEKLVDTISYIIQGAGLLAFLVWLNDAHSAHYLEIASMVEEVGTI